MRSKKTYNDNAANKGRSTVNYRQSLAFDRPYLQCTDHCGRWFFQEIFFCYFQKQPYAIVLQNRCFYIHRKTSVLESLFNNFIATLFQPCPKRGFNTSVSREYCQILTNSFFIEQFRWWLLLSV